MPATGLIECHHRLGARLTEFAGWTLPVSYGSILEEVGWVREKAGLFDLSHMGEIEVSGRGAFESLQRLTTNDIGRLGNGDAQYSLICREDGGVLDDLILYRLEEERYLLVVNAINRQKDLAWIQSHCHGMVNDLSDVTGLIALQGPWAADILQLLCPVNLDRLEYPGILSTQMRGAAVWIARTGYTGEDGFEIMGPWQMEGVWETLIEAVRKVGGGPCGLGARDILRIEAGYCLWGQELTEDRDPYCAGLGWVIRPEKGDFIGKDALLQRKEGDPKPTRRVGLIWKGRAPVRSGEVYQTEWGPGLVTSGTYSPTVGASIGMGYVPARRKEGRVVAASGRVWIEGKRERVGEICRFPFVRGSVRRGG